MNQLANEQVAPVPARAKISAFVITFNEERHIEDCLRSLSFCDEMLVIDSFSSDRTVDIAKSCGAEVVQRSWQGYRDQKAFGLAQVKHEWVINLDADERVSDELRESILKVLTAEVSSPPGTPRPSGYLINRVVFYLGRWWRQGGWYPEYRLRFFRKSRTIWGGVEPHEKPVVDGMVERIPGEILHYTYSCVDDQLMQLHRFSSISAQEEYAKDRKVGCRHLLLNPAMRVCKFFFFKKGYKEGLAGLIAAMAEGYYVFMKYAKLWELHFNDEQNEEEHGVDKGK